MIAKEILEIMSISWRSNQDIMKIANVSARLNNQLRKNLGKKEPINFDSL